MALILILETATPVCSVALCHDGKVLSSRDSSEHNDHAAVLAVFIREIFEETGFLLKDIDAVAVSKGPGSYTGLRIGVSTAKGLCYSLDKPLIAMNTLLGMAYGMIHYVVRERYLDKRTFFCPMLDARRMEVYCSVFDDRLTVVEDTTALVVEENSFSGLLEKNEIIFFGDGALKTEVLLGKHRNSTIIKSFNPSAAYFNVIAEQAFQFKEFEDIACFEPYYLKDFIAGAPKVKGLK